jgi:hypothetical protein
MSQRLGTQYADDVAIEKRRRGRDRGGLRACPFCRELATDDDPDTCPECGIALRDLRSLPRSADADAVHEEDRAHALAPIPQAEPLPWTHVGRGRGVLLGIALLGLIAFHAPWAIQTLPESVSYSAAELARKQSFFWSAFAAWLVLVPAVASRRTLLRMVSARLPITFLSAMPGLWCAFLLTRPTRVVRSGVPFEYHFGPGFWATLVLSVVATLVAIRFGGRLDDVEVRHGSSAGEVLH